MSEARQQCALLMNMFQNMEALYSDLAEYYVFDKQKYTLNEFFTDLKMFKDDFYVSLKKVQLNSLYLIPKLMVI